MKTQIAIVGAGPIGLEVALRASVDGYEVRLYEANSVAENIRQWGFVRLFTPFAMNSSKQGRGAVADCFADHVLPPGDVILTGEEYRDRYLQPLSKLPILANRIVENSRVVSIGRDHLSKGEEIGQDVRSQDVFRLLVETPTGEDTHFAEIVLDCSGTYGTHRWVGAGGGPCPGERTSLAENNYLIPDVEKESRDRFSNRTTLVIGGGCSAATTVVALSKLSEESTETKVIWITRHRSEGPVRRIKDDPLAEREQLARQANNLASHPNSAVEWIPNASILEIFHQEDRKYRVLVRVEQHEDPRNLKDSGDLEDEGFRQELIVDEIVANVGYKPDRSIYEELQFHECYATQGPMKLAAQLLGESSPDCLDQSSQGIESLANPEPNFYILGSKSYGRDSRFLIRTGLEQIDQLFVSLAEKCKSANGLQ